MTGPADKSPSVKPVTGVVVCDERAHSCRCRAPKGHYPASPHACPCGGAWWGREGFNTFEVVSWPQGIGPGALLAGILPAPIPGLGFDESW